MPTKFQLITELYDQTVQSVTGSYQSWTGFLRAACYNYKCPFDEQLLIYAQRPDATAVLEMERWNRQFGRWVNRGAKSIAVFGDDGQNCLKLYFDVSDTHASRFARPLPIWTMHPAFEPEVIETLEATFGNLAEKENLADAVRSACHNAVADNFTDYLQDLRECREDSLLEELDDLNLEVFYRDALEVSVAYMLMTRLGLRADDYFSPDEKHRLSVYASAQHIGRDSYYGGNQDLNAYGATKDFTWVAGSQYIYHFDRCLFMPSDLTGGVEYNQDNLKDDMWGYNRYTNQTSGIYNDAILQ